MGSTCSTRGLEDKRIKLVRRREGNGRLKSECVRDVLKLLGCVLMCGFQRKYRGHALENKCLLPSN